MIRSLISSKPLSFWLQEALKAALLGIGAGAWLVVMWWVG